MSLRHHLAFGLASAMLGGPWERRPMMVRCATAIGASGTWLRRLVNRTLERFPSPPLDARDAFANWLLARRELTQGRVEMHGDTPMRQWLPYFPQMRPSNWPVKRIDTLGDLERWLELGTSDLTWLADRKGLEQSAATPQLQNYRYVWTGHRLIEAPKQRLKHVQRQILHQILDEIPPHDAAHAFRRGRSLLTHARLHAGCETVMRFDLRAFFTFVPTPRVYGLFRAAGYPEQVARTLLALCTNRTPWSQATLVPFEVRQRLHDFHLPQGAPTSPALANLVAWSLDVRLTELARRFGATYSRYADDLVFSGDRHLSGSSLARGVASVAISEGFLLNPLKSKTMHASRRQQVTGAVVNEGVNVPRDEFDRLKATLTNCVRHGLQSQTRGIENFRAHLEGRVAWVESLNPRRGATLRRLLAAAD